MPTTIYASLREETHNKTGERFIPILIAVDDTHRPTAACTRDRVEKPERRVDVGFEDRNGYDRGRDVGAVRIAFES